MIQKTTISQFHFNSRSVFVVAVSAILEGERDYSEQPLATPTLSRSHFLRGVVNMVLVSVKVQGVKDKCFSARQKSGLYMHQKPIRAQPKKLIVCISLFCAGHDRIPEK